VVSILVPCFGGPRFKSQPGDAILTEVFCVFPQSLLANAGYIGCWNYLERFCADLIQVIQVMTKQVLFFFVQIIHNKLSGSSYCYKKMGPTNKSKTLKRRTISVDSTVFAFMACICKICTSRSKIIPHLTSFPCNWIHWNKKVKKSLKRKWKFKKVQ
jgi:hypothetical protein